MVATGYPRPAFSQNAKREFWPEFDVYVQQNEIVRIVFADSGDQDRDINYRQGKFAYYVDFALRPVFRRELRWRSDVFRQRYLDFRTGCEYLTSLSNNSLSHESRIVIEVTPRYRLPGAIVIDNRNRAELRFIDGSGFSQRYRNRLQVNRDFGIRKFLFTPFVNAEVFYDTRYSSWTTERYELGVQIPVGPHLLFEPYAVRQHDTESHPSYINAIALTVKVFF